MVSRIELAGMNDGEINTANPIAAHSKPFQSTSFSFF